MSHFVLTDEQLKSILKECQFHTSRSGGKGGQNVNKVETKVEIEFDVAASEVLDADQKKRILHQHKNIIDERLIKVLGNRHRSQLENKEEAKAKLLQLLQKLLKPVKKRVPTKPGKAAKENKLKAKKHKSDKKILRRKVSDA